MSPQGCHVFWWLLCGHGSKPMVPYLGGYSHPFTSYFDVHQGYRVLTHNHVLCCASKYFLRINVNSAENRRSADRPREAMEMPMRSLVHWGKIWSLGRMFWMIGHCFLNDWMILDDWMIGWLDNVLDDCLSIDSTGLFFEHLQLHRTVHRTESICCQSSDVLPPNFSSKIFMWSEIGRKCGLPENSP